MDEDKGTAMAMAMVEDEEAEAKRTEGETADGEEAGRGRRVRRLGTTGPKEQGQDLTPQATMAHPTRTHEEATLQGTLAMGMAKDMDPTGKAKDTDPTAARRDGNQADTPRPRTSNTYPIRKKDMDPFRIRGVEMKGIMEER